MGEAGLVEQAWWRYGRELRKRKASYESKRSEEFARIIDQELTPRRLVESHLRRFPIKLKPSLATASWPPYYQV